MLDKIIGQDVLKRFLYGEICTALKSRGHLPHLLLCAPREMGKSTIAKTVAEELGVEASVLMASALSKVLDISGAMSVLQAYGVLVPFNHSLIALQAGVLCPGQGVKLIE